MTAKLHLLLPFFFALAGCPSTNNDKEGGVDAAVMCTMAGGPVTGAPDNHCSDDGGDPIVTIDMAACHPVDAAADPDAGVEVPHGPVNGSEADDDDCKYHVKWSATPICRDGNVTFTVTVTTKADGKPAAMSHPYAEVFLPPSHVAPNTMPTSSEPQPGVYTIGPHRFDQAGKWTVRFHFHPECEDGDDSPHGEVAFFVNVP